MMPFRSTGCGMQQGLRDRAMDGAKAMRSRAFLTLLAILTLCAIPLGTGDLFAAGSHLVERNAIGVQHGDLPRRIAMPVSNGPTELAEKSTPSISLLALLDDTPDAVDVDYRTVRNRLGRNAASVPAAWILAAPHAGFNARAPPLS
jgi:hypothetical protein